MVTLPFLPNLRRRQRSASAGRPTPPSRQLRRLSWLIPLSLTLLVLGQELAEQALYPGAADLHSVIEVGLYGVAAPAALWAVLRGLQRQAEARESAEADRDRLDRRLGFLMRVNRRLAEAADEAELAELALRVPAEIAPHLLGSALIRFDAHRQPMPVEFQGALDEAVLMAWHAHLSSPAVRHACQTCRRRQAAVGQGCPLLKKAPLAGAGQVICWPLERNGREYGSLGVFLPAGSALTDEEHDLFATFLAEVTIALESARLRAQELTALTEINEALYHRRGVDGLMTRLLTQAMEAGQAEAGAWLSRDADGAVTALAVVGEWGGGERLALAERLAADTLTGGGSEPAQAPLAAATALCAPLWADDGALGALVLCTGRPRGFAPVRVRLVAAIARQAALLMQHTRLSARLERQAILAERGRLAREMHDGLAQTLGFIKMRAGQAARWLEAGQTQPAATALREMAHAAGTAYLDLRAALDGLRLPLTDGAGLAGALRRCVQDFEAQSGLQVEASLGTDPALSAPAQAHLLRLTQEALTNVRKHARATHVRLNLTQTGQGFCLEVQDDGLGFDAAQAPPDNRHGLRLMRERAELLGAQLEVTSAPAAGTRVCLRVPARATACQGQVY